MPDIAAISGALTSLKVSTDLAKAMLGLRDAKLIDAKALELTAQIVSAHQSALAAQAAQFELIERERALSAELMKMKNWDREKRKYQLKEVAPGVFAYTSKPGMKPSEPPHNLCANCYNNGRKSILQSFSRSGGGVCTSFLMCQACAAEMPVASKSVPLSAPSRSVR